MTTTYISNWLQSFSQKGNVAVAFTIIFGVLSLLLGYRLLKLWVTLIGFVIGAVIGGVAAAALGANNVVIILVTVAAGIAIGVCAFCLYRIGVFLYVGIMGFGAATNILAQFVTDPKVWWVIVIGVLVGICLAILASKMLRPMVIVTTSISGAVSVAANFLPLIKATNTYLILASAVVLACAGIAVQFLTTKESKGRR
ncbi:MAG: DUF4203 domain-containing protein [Lachnospiraceae bacterium]|nr:DUF4203 domain-containing protein [Lachnospiraceae bacterium]